ncbi:LPXTG cell wall anchor domain-containing protein [Streptomyces sp. NPDC048718]|uniref:LPXTG cell wall anchor domain-containing protein n=1 Tax=Streptomyces sp. NPDC048718 TaxID=3365587 RepID=UPI00371432D2
MKIRGIAAIAVAAAVTAPALFLSAAPAFADPEPAPSASKSVDEVYEELKQAVAAAKAALDKAVKAEEAATGAVEALVKADHPLAVAAEAAEKASKDAAAAKSAADAALAAAEKALAELPEGASEEEKAGARQAVDTAKSAAATAEATAGAKAAEAAAAGKALDDARVAATRALHLAQQDRIAAEEALAKAEKALNSAPGGEPTPGEPQPECRWRSGEFPATLTGPERIARGSSAVFTYRLTNASSTNFKKVSVEFDAYGREGKHREVFPVEWAFANSSSWRQVPALGNRFSIGALASGKSVDLKLKVSVDAKSTLHRGWIVALAEWRNDEKTCGESDGSYPTFDIVKAGKPGSGTGSDGGHGTNGSTGGSNSGGNGNSSPQGGSGTTPVNTTSSGNLASTGAGSSTLPFALAGGAAVVLGGGAMVMVRRRKAGVSA